MRCFLLTLLLLLAACQTTQESDPPPPPVEPGLTPSPEGASVYFIEPANNDIVASGAVRVVFGLAGMGVAPAGGDFPDTGHHHLLVNVPELPPLDEPVPSDSAHLHFGKGQTETTLDLGAGTYTLQLVFGDMLHIPHDPPVLSEQITITVK